jgi:hypothetical protein
MPPSFWNTVWCFKNYLPVGLFSHWLLFFKAFVSIQLTDPSPLLFGISYSEEFHGLGLTLLIDAILYQIFLACTLFKLTSVSICFWMISSLRCCFSFVLPRPVGDTFKKLVALVEQDAVISCSSDFCFLSTTPFCFSTTFFRCMRLLCV